MTAESFLGRPVEQVLCLCGRVVRVWRRDRIVVLAHPASVPPLPDCESYLGLDDPERFVAMLRARKAPVPDTTAWQHEGFTITRAEVERLARLAHRLVRTERGWMVYPLEDDG